MPAVFEGPSNFLPYTNNIILNEHHGSRNFHSTTTALAIIHHHLNNYYYANKITAIVQTDLSSIFDTVDHDILLQKLRHYGIINKENNIIKSLLENRFQYVEVDGVKSEVIQSNSCSVLQGSKLSSLLYTIYCN